MSVYPSYTCFECGNKVFFSSCSGNGHNVGHKKECSKYDPQDDH